MCVCVCLTKEQRREAARGAEQERGSTPPLSPSLSTLALSNPPSRTRPHSSPLPSNQPSLQPSPFLLL
eukprot:1694125-Rhodomonas_salina.1